MFSHVIAEFHVPTEQALSTAINHQFRRHPPSLNPPALFNKAHLANLDGYVVASQSSICLFDSEDLRTQLTAADCLAMKLSKTSRHTK